MGGLVTEADCNELDDNEYQWGDFHGSAKANAGARLDRLPISSFHYRIFWLVGAGMFFDGYDLYVAGGVLASAIQSNLHRRRENLPIHFANLRRHDRGRADHGLYRR